MRDRLIKLIMECSTFTPRYANQARSHAEYVANHLINNGVTIRERGEWIEDGCCNNCSRCGGEVARYDDDDCYQDFDFCPNCGADMRGKAEC